MRKRVPALFLLVMSLLIARTVGVALAQENPCASPGVLLASDPAGDGNQGGIPPTSTAAPYGDILSLSVMEDWTGLSDKHYTFILHVSNLTSIPPGADWTVEWTQGGTPAGVRLMVTVETTNTAAPVAAVAGAYGYTIAGAGSDNTTYACPTPCASVPVTVDAANNNIIIKFKLGSTSSHSYPADTTNGVPAFTADFPPGLDMGSIIVITGQGASGVVSAYVDRSSPVVYTTVGNTFCAPNAAPVARLTATPPSGTVPLNVTFDGSASSDPDLATIGDTIASWDLDFGDTTTHATGSGTPPNNIAHTYASAGTYTATLSVTDSRGKPSVVSAQGQATIAVSPANTGQDFFTVAPCRLYDSRITDGALANGAVRTLAIVGTCGIPGTAKAVSFNFTSAESTAGGHVSFYGDAGAEPVPGTVHFTAGQNKANNQVLKLAAAGSVQARATLSGGATHIVVDVNGYFQ